MQFEPLEQWIWLPEDRYPDRQKCKISETHHEPAIGPFTVARSMRSYRFDQPVASLEIRAGADTFFRLCVNDRHVMTGPASVGGDFLSCERVRPQQYATIVTLDAQHPGFAQGVVDFSALVRVTPIRMFEYSHGQGGFFLTARVRFADGTKAVLVTDESWQLTCLPAYAEKDFYDGTRLPDAPVFAQRIENRWHCLTSPIPPMTEHVIPLQDNRIVLAAGESTQRVLQMDRIYTGYPVVHAETKGKVEVTLRFVETQEEGGSERYVFTCSDACMGTGLQSAGKLIAEVKNHSDEEAVITVDFLASHYPVSQQAFTRTDDDALNQVLDVCAHTLKYCRQTLHLDSGRHCEPLACTGDYYIEALMTAFTFGDQRLSAFDVRRTAQLLRYNDGRMFHTTYSLIWVQMLWDVYMLTGEEQLLIDCEDALTMLLARFKTYFGDNGLIETPPDYMFIDWLFPDGISTHHPPKALGQTCLNLFCYGAYVTAEKIYAKLSEPAMAADVQKRAQALKKNILAHLYDPQRGLFFEGLNTPTPGHLLYHFMPQNVDKRYYRMHANILAAYFGIMEKEDCAALLERTFADETLGVVQPYFAHFLLEAVLRSGLREKHTLRILQDWKAPVAECPYGLAEGFHKPEPTYQFDHSHAWGGTPAYSLPMALTGFEMLEPGFRKIRFSPSLLGLAHASVQIPTPFGMITVEQRKGAAPAYDIPDEIEWEVNA